MPSRRKVLIIVAHAVIGWALCFATIGVGLAVTALQPALIAHAIGAPIYFIAVSAVYFTRFAYTAPLPTALTFTGFVVAVDFFLVALVILRSLDMFTSPLGAVPAGVCLRTPSPTCRRRTRRTHEPHRDPASPPPGRPAAVRAIRPERGGRAGIRVNRHPDQDFRPVRAPLDQPGMEDWARWLGDPSLLRYGRYDVRAGRWLTAYAARARQSSW